MRICRCAALFGRVSAGKLQGLTVTLSPSFETYCRKTCSFWALFHSFANYPRCIKRIGMLSSFIEFGDVTFSKDLARVSPSINPRRTLSFEAKHELSEVTKTPVSATSLAIDTVSGILRSKPWGLETIKILENLHISYDVHIVRKVLKSVPVDSALDFFHWLKSQPFEHDFSTYHAMIDALGEGRCLDKMKDLVEEMHKAGHTMRVMLYRDVLYWCACAGDTTGVFSYWEEMKKAQIKPSASIYTTFISVHAKEQQYELAVKIYAEMVAAGLLPNPRTFSIFIDRLVDLGKLDAAALIISKMKVLKMFPVMSTYARLMALHAKAGNVAVVKKMGKDLRNVCDRPGKVFCMAVKSVLSENMDTEAMIFAGEVWPELSIEECLDFIHNSLQILEEEKVSSSGILTGIGLDSEVADKSTDHDRTIAERRQTVSYLQMEKILNDWNASTIALLEKANFNWNNDIIFELLSKGIQKPQVAWDFFWWLKAHAGVQIDVFNQITMLRILSKNQKFSNLVLLLGEIQRERTKLSIGTFNFIIRDCSLAKNAKVAFWVYAHIKEFKLEPDQESLTALMQAYLMDTKHEEAFFLFDMMQQAGYIPDSLTCTLLIRSLGLAGKADKAQSVFQQLLDSDGNPSVECYTALIKAYGRVGNVELAIQTYYNMKAAGIVPVKDTLRSMGWVCLQCSNLEKFQEFMKLAKETPSKSESALICQREALMSINEVLVTNLDKESEICFATPVL